MIFPVLYAVVLWYLAAKFRRTWRGVFAVFIGLMILVLIGSLAIEGERGWLPGSKPAVMPEWWQNGSKQVLVLLIPYTMLVGTVAVFLVVLPRLKLKSGCVKCGYDLTGLRKVGMVCPECGEKQGTHECPSCEHDLTGLNPLGLLCPKCGKAWEGIGSGLEDLPEVLVPIPRTPAKNRRVSPRVSP